MNDANKHSGTTGKDYTRPAWFPDDAAKPYPSPDGAPLSLSDYVAARQRPEPPRYRRPMMARENFDELHEGYDLPRRYRGHQRAGKSQHRKRDFVLALSLAAATASIVGLMAFDRSAGGPIAGRVSAAWHEAWFSAPASQGNTVVVKKTVATAKLKVEDATAAPGAPISLSLKSESGATNHDLALRLTGIPPEAYLTAGTRTNDASWLLKQGEEHDVKLMLPKGIEMPTSLTVTAIEPATGELAAPSQELAITAASESPSPTDEPLVIPAAAAPEIQRASNGKANLKELFFGNRKSEIAITSNPPPKPVNAEAVAMMTSGDNLMKSGEIIGARQFYQRALDLGMPQAAFKLGQTYDPAIFAAKKVRGLTPDAVKADAFYAQARAAGVADAETATAEE